MLDYQDYTAHGFLLQVEVCSKKDLKHREGKIQDLWINYLLSRGKYLLVSLNFISAVPFSVCSL